VITETVRKSTLALILVFLAAGVGKAFAQGIPIPPPSQPSPDGGNPGGGDPDPTCGDGGCLVAIHSA